MELMTVIALRFVERLIGILVGAFLAWLGYRLFVDIPAKADSSGKFNLPGGTAIHLTRVGPGIFFSLFGTGIVLSSFMKPVDFKQESLASGLASAPAAIVASSYSAATGGSVSAVSSKRDLRNLRRSDIAMLNRLPGRLQPGIDPSERATIVVAVPQIKLALMETLWSEDWGDFTRFKDWVNSGESTPPAALKAAADYFNSQ